MVIYVMENERWCFNFIKTEKEPALEREDYKIMFEPIEYQKPLKLANDLPPY